MGQNVDAVKIYNLSQGQVITAGMDGTVIDIDQMAVWKNIEQYGVENPRRVFEKIVTVFRHFNKRSQEEARIARSAGG